MNQHPVPQHISSYEFKLVGDMTLKQFFQLAGGAVLSLLIYASPMPGYIKWPLVLLFGAFGAALAFLPIEERPLSTWIFAFLKAVYSPTIYVYNASAQENAFAKSENPQTIQSGTTQNQQPQSVKTGVLETFEQAEKNFINRVGAMFQTGHNQTLAQPQTGSTAPAPAPQIIQNEQSQAKIIQENVSQTTPLQTQTQPNMPPYKIEEQFKIPQISPVKVGLPQQTSQQPQEQAKTTSVPISQYVSPVFQNLNRNLSTSQQATFSQEASPPSPPERPNTITGQALTSDGKIVDGAILEIRDSHEKPVRAIKTNKLGHFLTVTPLQDGEYEIQTEREPLQFDPIHFTAEGKIIPPIQIKARV